MAGAGAHKGEAVRLHRPLLCTLFLAGTKRCETQNTGGLFTDGKEKIDCSYGSGKSVKACEVDCQQRSQISENVALFRCKAGR